MSKTARTKLYLLCMLGMVILIFLAGVFQRQINGLTFDLRNHIFPSLIGMGLGALFARLLILQKIYRIQKEQLENQHNTIRSLVREVTHDLRSPIGAVSSLSEILLMEHDQFNAKQLEVITSIKESSDHMLAEVNRIVESIKENYSREDLSVITLDIVRNIRNILETLKPMLRRKNIRIDFHTDRESLILPYSSSKFRSAFTNLISNAVKFSSRSSSVEVSLNIERDGFLKIAIADSGQGLNEEDKQRVFQKYQQLSAKPTQGEPTAGLGLYLVKRSVEEMGGQVGVNSDGKNRGATFWFTLPLQHKVD